jgi:NADPH:quinone reductase-like Zn-dependent oxidoreductase
MGGCNGKMKAVALDQPGGTLAVTELPLPEPRDDELLVRVHTASINPIDVRVSTGRYPWGKYDYPVVPGFDFAGVVERAGSEVTRFQPGDHVLGYWSARRFHRGSWAEYLAVPESRFVVHKPSGVSFEQAAAMPLAAVTALLSVGAVVPSAGEPVLIAGAAGAVGTYAVQLAAATGASVVATARPEQEPRVRELGAADTIDYRRDDLVEALSEAYPEGLGALVDLANDRDGVARLAALVRDGGRVASACFGADPQALSERGIVGTNVIATHCDPGVLAELVALVEASELTIGYDELRPLREVPAAVQERDFGSSRKTVIDVAAEPL